MTTTTSAVILNGPQDWIKWDELFKSEAIANSLWDAINPDSPTVGEYLTRPLEPDVTKYNKRLDVPVTRSATSTQTVGRSQTPATPAAGAGAAEGEPEIVELLAPDAPKSANELTTASRQAYQIDMSRFYEMRRQYDKQIDRVALLKRWVNDHVTEHYRSTDCKAEKPIHEWYANLKKHVGSSLVYEKVQAEEAYQKAIQPLSKVPRDPMEWMKNWERAITRAQLAGVASASDSVSWWTALLKAANKIGYGHWFDSYFAVHKDGIHRGDFDFRQLVNEFSQSSIAIAPPKRAPAQRIGRGAFSTYHGHDQTSNGSESEAEGHQRSTRRRSRSPPRNKRKYSGEAESRCPVCKKPNHPLPACYYLFPEKAPAWFKIVPEIQMEFEERLKKDEEFRKEVERLKKKKRPDSRERYRKKKKEDDAKKEVRFEEDS